MREISLALVTTFVLAFACTALAASGGNNGWGNGGDTTNNGSSNGRGLPQGGQGAGSYSNTSKTNSTDR
jgi:hypothetical protein